MELKILLLKKLIVVLTALVALLSTPHPLKFGAIPVNPRDIVGEIVEKRTKYSKEFQLANGQHYLKTFAQPIHFSDSNGKFQDINLNMMDIGTSFTNGANDFNSFVPKAANGVFSDQYADSSINIQFVGASSSQAVLSGEGTDPYGNAWTSNVATYKNIQTGVDLTVRQRQWGIERIFNVSPGGSLQVKITGNLPSGFSSTSPTISFGNMSLDIKDTGIYGSHDYVNKVFRNFDPKTRILTVKADASNTKDILLDPTTVISGSANSLSRKFSTGCINGSTWAGLRSSSFANLLGTTNQAPEYSECNAAANFANSNLKRLGTCWNTSTIGSGSTISEATSSFNTATKRDTNNLTPNFDLVDWHPSSSSTFAAADGNTTQYGTSSPATLIGILGTVTYANALDPGYTRFNFTDFSKIYQTATTCQGMLIRNDTTNTSFTPVSGADSGINAQDDTGVSPPQLGIVYTTSAAVASPPSDDLNFFQLLYKPIKKLFVKK